jgi:prevent-host-death family protein
VRIASTEIQNNFGKYLKLAMEQGPVKITKNGKCVAKLSFYSENDENEIREYAHEYGRNRSVTYEAYLKLVEDTDVRYELIDGQIYVLASPKFKHQAAVSELHVHFYNWFKDKSCRTLMSPFDVKLFNRAERFEDDPNVVQPDLLVICDEEKITEEGDYEGTPTLVVEVLSQSTRKLDLLDKLKLYMNSNVKEYWIVDTEQQTVYVHVFEDRAMKDLFSFSKGMTVRSVMFTGLEIWTEDIFS